MTIVTVSDVTIVLSEDALRLPICCDQHEDVTRNSTSRRARLESAADNLRKLLYATPVTDYPEALLPKTLEDSLWVITRQHI
jgi:hypothetical protein